MQCSFILPAHDEQDWIEGSISAIRSACEQLGLEYEIVVAADACTDRTVELASAQGARVVEIDERHIAAARNAGARAASGETLFFVDADTEVNARAVQLGLQALADGALAGGSTMRFDGPIPFLMRVAMRAFCVALHLAGFAGGCFLYCRRDVFEAVQGFDQDLYVTEELAFARRVRKLGKFRVVDGRVLTSARKVRSYSIRESLSIVAETFKRGKGAYRDRERLAFWYGERRDDPGRSMGLNTPRSTPVASSIRIEDEPAR
jgi:glycosyltransferase involved in cell wall biosynthesis